MAVRSILHDVVALCGLKNDVTYWSDTNFLPSFSNERPGIILVYNAMKRPSLVVEVKRPCHLNNIQVLDDTNILGQGFSYGEMLRSYFGMNDAVVILTTLDEWRLCWLNTSTMFPVSVRQNQKTYNTRSSTQIQQATLFGTKFTRNDPKLLKALMTLVRKSYESRPIPFPVISTNRAYAEYHLTSWRWSSIDNLPETQLRLGIPCPSIIRLQAKEHDCSRGLYILRPFFASGGGDGCASIIFDAAMTLGVIKLFYDSNIDKNNLYSEETFINSFAQSAISSGISSAAAGDDVTEMLDTEAVKESQSSDTMDFNELRYIGSSSHGGVGKRDEEQRLWQELWGVETIPLTVAKHPALILPLVFTSIEKDGERQFQLCPSTWANAERIGSEEELKGLEDIRSKIEAAMPTMSFETAKQMALDSMRAKNYEQSDFKDDHVGLMPLIDCDGNFSEYRPVIIDLSRMKRTGP